MKKRLFILLFISTSVLFLLNAKNGNKVNGNKNLGKTKNEIVKNAISDTLKIGTAVTTRHLMKLAEPAFKAKFPNAVITSTINETGNVVADVISGKGTIAVTTRDLKIYEKEKSATITAIPIGYDGLVLTISTKNKITSLTFDQIVAIWTGKYTNWKELGGKDLPIVLIGRSKGYDPIKLFGDFMKLDSKMVDDRMVYSELGKNSWSKNSAIVTENDEEALEILNKTPGAITYLPLQVLNDYKSKGNNIKDILFDGIKATPQTIANGEYFIHRRLNVITNGKPKEDAKSFIEFLLSNGGQELVKKAGFLTINLNEKSNEK
jgi:phosphate transport system substrate-binding protein